MKKILDSYVLAYQIEGIPHHVQSVIREMHSDPNWDGSANSEWFNNLGANERTLIKSFVYETLIVRENYKNSNHFKERISLVSYPRSANTFTRYIFEKLTNYKSMPYAGFLMSPVSSPPSTGWDESGIIAKHHFIGDLCELNSLLRGNEKEKIVLLLRNPVENFLRHCGPCDPGDTVNRLDKWLENSCQYAVSKSKLYNRFGTMGPDTSELGPRLGNHEYFRNIESWLHMPEDKRFLLTYEELVERPRSFVDKAYSIVEDPIISVDEFMKNYDKHFEFARRTYSDKFGQIAHSSGKSADTYSRQVGSEIIQKIWKRSKECCLSSEALALLEELYEERNSI